MSNIEARRDIRRRKILENSEKRLLKITGVQNKKLSDYDLEGYKSVSDSDEIRAEYGFNDQLPPAVEGKEQASVEPSPTLNINKLNFFKAYRFQIIILLAFFVNILSGVIRHQDSSFVNNIFIPLLCFEVGEIFQTRTETNKDLSKLLLIFRTVRQYQLDVLLQYFAIIKTIFRDVMVYFFVFVCILYVQSIVSKFCMSFV